MIDRLFPNFLKIEIAIYHHYAIMLANRRWLNFTKFHSYTLNPLMDKKTIPI